MAPLMLDLYAIANHAVTAGVTIAAVKVAMSLTETRTRLAALERERRGDRQLLQDIDGKLDKVTAELSALRGFRAGIEHERGTK